MQQCLLDIWATTTTTPVPTAASIAPATTPSSTPTPAPASSQGQQLTVYITPVVTISLAPAGGASAAGGGGNAPAGGAGAASAAPASAKPTTGTTATLDWATISAELASAEPLQTAAPKTTLVMATASVLNSTDGVLADSLWTATGSQNLTAAATLGATGVVTGGGGRVGVARGERGVVIGVVVSLVASFYVGSF